MTGPDNRASVKDMAELPKVIARLGLTPNVPVLSLVGGAAGLTEDIMPVVTDLLAQVVVPLLERLGAVVVYGGTDAGVMRAMGTTRRAASAGFPLLGVAPEGKVAPSAIAGTAAPLEPNHTHFLTVPGRVWGDESPWLFAVASAIAGRAAALTLVLNGGDVTVIDVEHSLARSIPVLVVAGTGRTADLITVNSPDARARVIAESPITYVVDARDHASARERLSALLRTAGRTGA
ncbi:hypothetical protein DMA12_48655 [Amycolatopsis balhimycina DSM 5908]|uniref:LSDAT prokaryote domain-containing protein n=1 Tax=Amycolatopsis balhimycina DSM 5908 TaxID=1081091 RepID=A0A428VU63_AMYBA|nr:hypothetical protein [Amycolatopsis balhimycina]RSM34357.1 hypothetical protein DMA12_48655 [Amycolatopsis balhimycina DSM 5908]